MLCYCKLGIMLILYQFEMKPFRELSSVTCGPVAESFVAVCEIPLKFHYLSTKLLCNFNEKIMH